MTTAIGRVVALQVQTGSLKRGERPNRVYDPRPLVAVSRLRVSPQGAEGERGGKVLLDVHHAAHSASKSEPGREVSFGFTGHYDRMRTEYGEQLAVGCAGENVLIESERVWRLPDLADGLAFRSRETGALIPVTRVSVADPCVEFSRYALREPEAPPLALKPVLQFLGDGIRGYCFTPAESGSVEIGDSLVTLGPG